MNGSTSAKSGEALRVLIVAENASARLGGEAILPCHYFRLLRARGVDVHLIVHARCRSELSLLFPDDRARVHFVEDQWLQRLFYRVGLRLPRRVQESTFGLANQMLTQHAQRDVIRTLRTELCVVHQPIPVSPRMPSLLYDLGAPVVMGPLNGGMEYPAAFRRGESRATRAFVAVGRWLSGLVHLALPGKRLAATVLVANARTRAALPAGVSGRVVSLPENAVDLAAWRGRDAVSADTGEPRFVFIGRLVDWKALDVAMDALRAVQGATLEVIGDGPMLPSWRLYAQTAGVGERVRFLGWLTQRQCAERLSGCCALVLPSVYECGGAVVLEAMAMSRPVIATAWGGPLDYLDATCGILVEPSSREGLVAGFTDAMRRLLVSPDLRCRMGEAGRKRLLAEFDWDRKIDAMLTVYAEAVANERDAYSRTA